MIILQDTNTTQSFSIIPRFYTAESISFTSESTGATLSYAVTPVLDRYYHVISGVFNLVEGNYYTLKVYDDSNDVVYRDKVFVTNQTIADYSVNDGEYITHTTDNEFIIIS